ncbi:MAG: peptidoglycan DD-metalloendopeptidase family protein [Bacteroidia bacterium]|nr:peptidoglycan DD-metalloendopeptidase family protein [Bacteroidia bacterium]
MKYSILRLLELICLSFLMCFAVNTFGQSLEALRKQKEKTASEIEYINNLLKETNSNAKVSLNRLAVLERQIKLQDNLINNITGEISYLDTSIQQNSKRIDSLSTELQAVKVKYASMIRYAHRNQDNNNQLLFLLSAQDFNQAYKRFIYLRQYADYRRNQAERITEFKNSITNQLLEFNKRKEEKQSLLVSKVNQTKIIEQQKKQQNDVYSDLQQKGKDLKKKLENQRKVELRLQQEIERVISDEAKKAGRKSSAEPGFALTSEEKVLSGDFSNNRGKFPWPVQRGLITDHFGEHPHAVLKYVIVRNSGIDITTQANAKARAIFKGEVTKVVAIPGGNMAVIIRHGNYLTVYSNLSEVFVKEGQKVEIKEEVGNIFTDQDEDNKTVLKFQLWRENNKLDPEDWLSRQ